MAVTVKRQVITKPEKAKVKAERIIRETKPAEETSPQHMVLSIARG